MVDQAAVYVSNGSHRTGFVSGLHITFYSEAGYQDHLYTQLDEGSYMKAGYETCLAIKWRRVYLVFI